MNTQNTQNTQNTVEVQQVQQVQQVQNSFKLVAIGSVRSTIAKAVKMKQDATISAMFYGIIAGDVSWSNGMIKTDAVDFDTVLRSLLPIKWKNDSYKYDAKKVQVITEKLKLGDLEELRLQYRTDKDSRPTIISNFYDACMVYYYANEKEVKELTLEQMQGKAVTSVKSALVQAKKVDISLATVMETLKTAGYDVPNQWLQDLL